MVKLYGQQKIGGLPEEPLIEEILILSAAKMIATILEETLSLKGHSVKCTKKKSMTSWWNWEESG